ncbi:MAG: hypothetical protein JXB46_03105 [Candidatus Eisenbacteria bacterium]|nr:hypothetical protein [Candidatus Eisenbacteria bacterium]
MEKRKRQPGFLAAMVICFVIAILAWSGVILRDDLTGRVIFGVVWTVLGVVWLGWYVTGFRRGRSEESKDGGAR